MGLLDTITSPFKDIGFEKTRRAIALLPLAFFGVIWFLVGVNPEVGAMARVFFALSACYGVAVVAVAAEWFWARWFAVGLGWFGAVMGAFIMAQVGVMQPFVIFTVGHAIVVLTLGGEKMAALYDYQEGWRTRWGMDEYGVARLRKTVTRASMALPGVIMWALSPRQDSSLFVLALTIAGIAGVVRARTWGLLALGGASAGLLVPRCADSCARFAGSSVLPFGLTPLNWAGASIAPSLAALLLAFAVLPFVRPAIAFVRDRSR